MATIWPEDELSGYVQEGYDDLVMRTGCLLGVALAPDYAFAFNYTQPFEAELITEGYADGPAQFTTEFERNYIDNAQGPANHTEHWEFNLGYVTITEVSGLVTLPEDLLEIERATWNTLFLDARRSRDFEALDARYELNKGQVESYIQDKDGLRVLRKWRVPSAPYIPYSFDASSDDGLGIIRDLTGIATVTVVSDGFGDLVQVDGVEVFEDFGILGPVYKEQNNMRIEYRRRGLPLSMDQDFEIPERYQVYVRHYALARAYERDGDGQDLALSEHYQSRYEVGVERMLRRKNAMRFQEKRVLGGGNIRSDVRPRLRMPYNYGSAVR